MPTKEQDDRADDEDEISAVLPTVFTNSSDLGSARWTLARGDDEEAPEVTCLLTDGDEGLAEVLSQSSRSDGHGLRTPVSPEKPDEDDDPSFVVTLYL